MSIEQDRAFYERRLGEELNRAANADDEQLRRLHLHWASLYEARLASFAPRLLPGKPGCGSPDEGMSGLVGRMS